MYNDLRALITSEEKEDAIRPRHVVFRDDRCYLERLQSSVNRFFIDMTNETFCQDSADFKIILKMEDDHYSTIHHDFTLYSVLGTVKMFDLYRIMKNIGYQYATDLVFENFKSEDYPIFTLFVACEELCKV